jgi:hypothetical protein
MFPVELLNPKAKLQVVEPLVDCPRLLIQYICSYPPHLKVLMIGLINMGTKPDLIPREERGLRVFENRVIREGDVRKEQTSV